MWAAGEVKVNIDKGTADPRHLSLSFNCIEPLQKDVLHHQLVVCFQLHNPEQIQITVMTWVNDFGLRTWVQYKHKSNSESKSKSVKASVHFVNHQDESIAESKRENKTKSDKFLAQFVDC